MSGITFGSVGDLIAVGEIAWSIAKALNSSRGSAKEYQSLVKELQLFNKVLLQACTSNVQYNACLSDVLLGCRSMAKLCHEPRAHRARHDHERCCERLAEYIA